MNYRMRQTKMYLSLPAISEIILATTGFRYDHFMFYQNDLQSLSVVIKYRLWKKSDELLGIEAGVGNSPDDILTTSQSSFNELMLSHQGGKKLQIEQDIRFPTFAWDICTNKLIKILPSNIETDMVGLGV